MKDQLVISTYVTVTQLITCSNIRIQSSPAAVAMASVTSDLITEKKTFKLVRNVDCKTDQCLMIQCCMTCEQFLNSQCVSYLPVNIINGSVVIT